MKGEEKFAVKAQLASLDIRSTAKVEM